MKRDRKAGQCHGGRVTAVVPSFVTFAVEPATPPTVKMLVTLKLPGLVLNIRLVGVPGTVVVLPDSMLEKCRLSAPLPTMSTAA